MSDRSQTGTQREKALAQVPNFFISAAGGTATAAKTPIVRSAPALTRRLVRPMPAVKMRRLHGRAVAAARPHSSCTATLLQPPASEERRATCQVASGL